MLKERKWKIVTRFFLSLFLLRAQKEEMEKDQSQIQIRTRRARRVGREHVRRLIGAS
mgnify:CR=1 FL=1